MRPESTVQQQTANSSPPQKPTSLQEVDQQEIFLDDFEFYEKLGSGSYGQVYKTKYKRTDEIFAIKTLDRDFVMKVGRLLFNSFTSIIEPKDEEHKQRERHPLQLRSSECSQVDIYIESKNS